MYIIHGQVELWIENVYLYLPTYVENSYFHRHSSNEHVYIRMNRIFMLGYMQRTFEDFKCFMGHAECMNTIGMDQNIVNIFLVFVYN